MSSLSTQMLKRSTTLGLFRLSSSSTRHRYFSNVAGARSVPKDGLNLEDFVNIEPGEEVKAKAPATKKKKEFVRKPAWLKAALPKGENYTKLKDTVRDLVWLTFFILIQIFFLLYSISLSSYSYSSSILYSSSHHVYIYIYIYVCTETSYSL